MVEATTRIGLVVGLVFYLGFILTVTPFFDPEAYSVSLSDLPDSQGFESNIFTVIADVIARFGILLTLSVSDPIVTLILAPLLIGLAWAILEVIAFAIP